MRIGIALSGSTPRVAALAAAAEDAGLDSVWLTELSHSAFVHAAVALSATRRIRVATGVAMALARSPTMTALSAWDLAELGDRFLLGLGTQVPVLAVRRFSVPADRPATRLAEYAQAVRAVWAAHRGTVDSHVGNFYRITMPVLPQQRTTRSDVPIIFAAVGPAAARAAGRFADGLLTHPLAPLDYVRGVILPAVEEGLADSGRQSGACQLINYRLALADGADEAAVAAAKAQIGFYAATPGYRRLLEYFGRPELFRSCRAAVGDGSIRAVAKCIDDAMLERVAMVVAGWPEPPPDAPGDEVVLAPAWYGVSERAAEHYYLSLIDKIRDEGQRGTWA